jgi:hypothetical protein
MLHPTLHLVSLLSSYVLLLAESHIDESFSEGCTNLSEMPESELIDPEGDSDMEDNVEDASVDPPMSQEVLGVNDPLYHDKGRESMSRCEPSKSYLYT